MKTKLRKNDMVVVLAGKDRGKRGKILQIDRENGKVLVQGLNMVKKAMKKRKQSDTGGIVERETPMHISNVALVAKGGAATRLGYTVADGKKKRIARKSGEVL